jgi:prolyl-tRNA synthetase
LGNRSLKEGVVEVKLRNDLQQTRSCSLDSLVKDTKDLVDSLEREIRSAMVHRELA